MDSSFNAEALLVITPVISLGTAIFNYFYNGIRNDNLSFKITGFLGLLFSSFIYSILLGIFTYFFYLIFMKRVYYRLRKIIVKK